MIRHTRVIFALILGLIPLQSFSIDTDSTLPIDIESDKASIDDTNGISSYSGNVIISQGLSKIEADHIIVRSKQRQLLTIEALGNPAHFVQQEAQEEHATHGYAKTITYTVADATLGFAGDASLIQEKNSFSGDQIIYDIKRKAIMAQGDEEEGSRVKIQYHPQAEQTPASEDLSAQPKIDHDLPLSPRPTPNE